MRAWTDTGADSFSCPWTLAGRQAGACVRPARGDVAGRGYWKPLAKMMSQVWFS